MSRFTRWPVPDDFQSNLACQEYIDKSNIGYQYAHYVNQLGAGEIPYDSPKSEATCESFGNAFNR